MRCLSCKYDLANLTPTAGDGGKVIHRCPECGRTFDPTIGTTFNGPEYRRLREMVWVKRCLVIMPCAFVVFGVAFALIVGDLQRDEIVAMFAVLVPCSIGLLAFLYWRSRRKAGREKSRAASPAS